MNHNNLIYQDSSAYLRGRRDGHDEVMSQMSDIIDKSYNTGYKDAMDFVCEWLYIYYPTIERCNSTEEAWKILEKEMEEHRKHSRQPRTFNKNIL